MIEFVVTAPDTDEAHRVLWAYVADAIARHRGRPATLREVDEHLRADPSDHLVPPGGVFVLARRGGTVLGCVGLRWCDGRIGEVKRLFVVPEARGRGLGARLLDHVEELASEHGASTLRLDTSAMLVEARRLYARHGYAEVAPFNDGPHADHWFAKRLSGA